MDHEQRGARLRCYRRKIAAGSTARLNYSVTPVEENDSLIFNFPQSYPTLLFLVWLFNIRTHMAATLGMFVITFAGMTS